MKRVAVMTTSESQREAIRSEAEILNSIITETWGYAKDREPALEWYELLMEALKSPENGNDPESAELPSE